MPIVLSGGFIVQITDKNLDSCSHLGGVKLIVIGLLDKLNFYSAIFCLCKDVVYQSANCEISSCSNFFFLGVEERGFFGTIFKWIIIKVFQWLLEGESQNLRLG